MSSSFAAILNDDDDAAADDDDDCPRGRRPPAYAAAAHSPSVVCSCTVPCDDSGRSTPGREDEARVACKDARPAARYLSYFARAEERRREQASVSPSTSESEGSEPPETPTDPLQAGGR